MTTPKKKPRKRPRRPGVCCPLCLCPRCPARYTIRQEWGSRRFRKCAKCGHEFRTRELVEGGPRPPAPKPPAPGFSQALSAAPPESPAGGTGVS